MESEAVEVTDAVNRLVDEYRTRCLWSLRADYYPKAPEEQLGVLAVILGYGDVEGYRRASELRQWLLQHSNATSARP